MLPQVETLRGAQKAKNIWNVMVDTYPILQEVVEKGGVNFPEKQEAIKQRLLHLYHEYVTEWDQVRAIIIQQGLLL